MAVLPARLSTFKIGSVQYEDIMSIEITGDDRQQLSFTDLQNGNTKEFTLNITAKVDMASGGLWKAVYDAATANSTLSLIWAPYGNTTASVSQPHIEITGAYVDGKPSLKIDADKKNKATVDLSLLCDDYDVVTA